MVTVVTKFHSHRAARQPWKYENGAVKVGHQRGVAGKEGSRGLRRRVTDTAVSGVRGGGWGCLNRGSWVMLGMLCCCHRLAQPPPSLTAMEAMKWFLSRMDTSEGCRKACVSVLMLVRWGGGGGWGGVGGGWAGHLARRAPSGVWVFVCQKGRDCMLLCQQVAYRRCHAGGCSPHCWCDITCREPTRRGCCPRCVQAYILPV